MRELDRHFKRGHHPRDRGDNRVKDELPTLEQVKQAIDQRKKNTKSLEKKEKEQ